MKDWLSLVGSVIGIIVMIALFVIFTVVIFGLLMWLAVQVGG